MDPVLELNAHATYDVIDKKLMDLTLKLIERTDELSSVFQEIDSKLKESKLSNSQELLIKRDNLFLIVLNNLKQIVKYEESLLLSQLFKPKRNLENFVRILTHQIFKISNKEKIEKINKEVNEFLDKSQTHLEEITHNIRTILTRTNLRFRKLKKEHLELNEKTDSLTTAQIENILHNSEIEFREISNRESIISSELFDLTVELSKKGTDIEIIDYITRFQLNFNKDITFIVKRTKLSEKLIYYVHLIENKVSSNLKKQNDEIEKSFFKKLYIEEIRKDDEQLKDIQREEEKINLSHLRESKTLSKGVKRWFKTALFAGVVMFNTACENQIKQQTVNKPTVVQTVQSAKKNIQQEKNQIEESNPVMNESHDLQKYLKFELDGINGEKNKQEAWRSYKVGLISRGKLKFQEQNIKSHVGVKRLSLLKQAFDESLDEVVKITLNKEIKYQSEDEGQSMFQVFLDGNNNCRESTMLFCAFVEEVDPQMFEMLLTINTPGHILPGMQTKNAFNQTTLTGCELTAKGTAIVKNMQKIQHRAILAKHQMILTRTGSKLPKSWIVSEKIDGEKYSPEKYGGTKASSSVDRYASSTAFGKSSQTSNSESEKSTFSEKEATDVAELKEGEKWGKVIPEVKKEDTVMGEVITESKNDKEMGEVIDVSRNDEKWGKVIPKTKKENKEDAQINYQKAMVYFLGSQNDSNAPLFPKIDKKIILKEFKNSSYSNHKKLKKYADNEQIMNKIIETHEDIYNKAVKVLEKRGVDVHLNNVKTDKEAYEIINRIREQMMEEVMK